MAAILQEFRDFLFRGSIIELAVAFVMGLAFPAVVNSLVVNLVLPIVTAIIGKPDFRDLTFTIHDSVFRYGAFLSDVIQFVAIAAAVFFFIVKPVQMMRARGERRSRSRRACTTRSTATRNCSPPSAQRARNLRNDRVVSLPWSHSDESTNRIAKRSRLYA